jgi:hypothetical protein
MLLLKGLGKLKKKIHDLIRTQTGDILIIFVLYKIWSPDSSVLGRGYVLDHRVSIPSRIKKCPYYTISGLVL